MSFLNALFGAKDKPSGRRSFLKRSAATGAALAVAPLAISGQEGGTGPGLAVTEKTPEPIRSPFLQNWEPAPGTDGRKFYLYPSVRNSHEYTSGSAWVTSAWSSVSPELRESRRAEAQSRKRDARGRFV